ncbi:MAG TPA: PKD domain-containing protein, partial [Anaeromyxobacteraceae bacterium]|nr:PKD domain-containing protein [Anaeromyxobacteraceae bacterium]
MHPCARVASLAAVVLLAACSGDDDEACSPPQADAGPDQNVPLGARVTLNGSRTRTPNGPELWMQWSFVSK